MAMKNPGIARRGPPEVERLLSNIIYKQMGSQQPTGKQPTDMLSSASPVQLASIEALFTAKRAIKQSGGDQKGALPGDRQW